MGAPAPKRARQITVSEIKTDGDGLGWFGHGDNGHWHLSEILYSRSFASLGLMLDELKDKGFEYIVLFDLVNMRNSEQFYDWLEEIALDLCDHHLHDWTSFSLVHNARWGRFDIYMIGFATMKDTDALFLMMATPFDLMAHRISLDEAIETF